MKRGRQSVVSDFIIGFILTVVTLSAFYVAWSPLEVMEYRLYDLESRLRDTSHQSPIVLVAIDDESITRMGRWPWPRGTIATMIETLKQYGARVIGVDILYSERDDNRGLLEVRKIIAGIEEDDDLYDSDELLRVHALLKDAEKNLDNDTILTASIQGSGNVIL